nr:MAG TPA: hypothetical protein [Bacteriophage sp.]
MVFLYFGISILSDSSPILCILFKYLNKFLTAVTFLATVLHEIYPHLSA